MYGEYDIDGQGRFRYIHEAELTEGMTFPVRCRCGHIYDLGKVEVTARYTDCSMWKTPCCGVLADDRKPPWGISWYTELPRRDRAFPAGSEETGPLTDVAMVCTVCRKPVTRGPRAGEWFHSDTSDPGRCSRTVPVRAVAADRSEEHQP